MTYRIGWLSPLTPSSGVGTFSNGIADQFPPDFDGEPIDLTILYVGHAKLYRNARRSIRIADDGDFHQILTLFDLLVYNIGNNCEHHESIFRLLRLYPGIVVSHDYVYQHFLADRAHRSGKTFGSFAALLLAYGGATAADCLRRSRITSRTNVRYSPWDSEVSAEHPMSDILLALGSSLVVHSSFAQNHAERCFKGPILRLGLPHDQRPDKELVDLPDWARRVTAKARFEMVSFGHVQPTKCIDLIISAIAASPILKRRIRYTVAGFASDGSYFERLKAMVANLSLQDCVVFESEVSDRRLDELIHAADIFCNLRRPNTEGASGSLVEQLITGKPVVIIDGGCYRDVPAKAAVKLPYDGDSRAIREALERLVGDPESMVLIGREGQVYARHWTCSTYAQELLRFAFANRDLLERRAKIGSPVASIDTPIGAGSDKDALHAVSDEAWTQDLARARLRLCYLDRNLMVVDPTIILRKTTEALSEYVAHVLLGSFGNARLEQALVRFFVGLDRCSAYWACVRFAVLAEAAFIEDEAARERLINLRPCHDIEFWRVIEALPARQCIAAATLMLARRLPKTDELCVTGLDDQDGFPKRLRIAELIRSMNPAPGSSLDRLGKGLLEACAPALERALPAIETDFECEVGTAAFRESVDLSGFYAPETNHAWTRGHQGFLGLRLGGRPVSIEMLVHHICAGAERPASIRMSGEGAAASIEVRDSQLHWVSIAIPAAGSARTVWLQVSTDVAAVPVDSHDPRLLGLCCLRLRVKAQEGVLTKPGKSRSRVPGLLKPVAAGLASISSRQGSWVRGAGSRAMAVANRLAKLRHEAGLGKYWQVTGKISRLSPIKHCTILLSKILVLSRRTLRKSLLT